MPDNKPLEEHEVEVHVPHGTGKHVQIKEVDPKDLKSEITVRVSSKRKPSHLPVLGVIVK